MGPCSEIRLSFPKSLQNDFRTLESPLEHMASSSSVAERMGHCEAVFEAVEDGQKVEKRCRRMAEEWEGRGRGGEDKFANDEQDSRQ